MKRFKQLISVIAAAAVMLGCLCVSAAAESPAGSLTVTIQGTEVHGSWTALLRKPATWKPGQNSPGPRCVPP